MKTNEQDTFITGVFHSESFFLLPGAASLRSLMGVAFLGSSIFQYAIEMTLPKGIRYI